MITPELLYNTLIKNVSKFKNIDVALLLSGGIDSSAILFSLLDVGARVNSYCITFEDKESSDFKFSKNIANIFSIPFTPIYLSRDLNKLYKELIQLAVYGSRYKVQFECHWPLMKAIQGVREKYILTGLGGDDYYCISKKEMIHFRQTIKLMDIARRENHKYRHQLVLTKIARDYKKEIYCPFYQDNIFNLFLGTSWDEINKPKQKWITIQAFKKQFDIIGYRKPQNLQLGDSGIKDNFLRLLKTSLNKKKFTNPIGIYNEIVKAVEERKIITNF